MPHCRRIAERRKEAKETLEVDRIDRADLKAAAELIRTLG